MAQYSGDTSFLFGTNETYIAEMYDKYLNDPGSIDAGWSAYFDNLEGLEKSVADDLSGPSWAPRKTSVLGQNNSSLAVVDSAPGLSKEKMPSDSLMSQMGGVVDRADKIRQATQDSIRALMLIRAYRVRGHLEADLDPLKLQKPMPHSELDPESYGFSESDMDRPIFINYVLGLESATLRDIVKILRETYCGSIGVEFMHKTEPDEKSWIQERIEGARNQTKFTKLGKRTILERLTEAELFEQFIDRKHKGAKRFGLDGGETTVPMLEQMLKRGGQLGIEEIVIGMPHRGRLNVLANVMGKPYRAIFSEFQGQPAAPEDVQGSGDVKYHLGTSTEREFDGNVVRLSLNPNPSHLEAVNTVVLGRVRAKQLQRGDEERAKVMAVLMHGDAAFSGQGIVPETFALSDLDGYETGGTIHLIVNNQIGFTTMPSFSRSSPYCSDMAKAVGAPIFHVNADDPEACVHVARLATEYRQRFKKDVVIDLICYRRHGHNEGDEPSFTQPQMYKKIAGHETTRTIYAKQLGKEKVIENGEADSIAEAFNKDLDTEFEAAQSFKPNKANWLEGKWSGLATASGDERRGKTGVSLDLLREVGFAISKVPPNVNVHPRIVRQLKAKRTMIESGEGFDWATAEALAFGTLLCESTPVRLSGEDCQRGTFSQRHSVLNDQESGNRYVPLNNIHFGQAPFEVIDSPLSEFGVLGYEYGYSVSEPHALVLWEAQFGDFANGAQVIIDQFISSGESKWLRMSGLVLLLPHGYEGQGPEHSSARLERYLQLCGEDNIQVANCTNPANYFHILRRQIRREFRKPLILMTPKSLLRHKRCVSSIEEFGPRSTFHRVLWDHAQHSGKIFDDKSIKRVVICSGKVYFDLLEERDKRGAMDTYLLRLEQLYPFPTSALRNELARFKNAYVVWCQEEPKNMGAWFFINDLVEELMVELDMKQRRPVYAGRSSAAAPATGLLKRHLQEQNDLVNAALTYEG